MKVDEKYLKKVYIAFGWKARDVIQGCVEKIIATLESMSKEDREALFAVLDPEVRNAIIDD